MNERNYFVPENLGELSSLEGKVVGVCITSINPPEPMVYYRFKDDKHEFLAQGKMRDERTNRYDLLNEVRVLKINEREIRLKNHGIVFTYPFFSAVYNSRIDIKEFEKRRDLLNENNLWMAPQ